MHRSYLYVPGNRADRLATACGLPTDAIIADLEDAVPAVAKAEARAAVAAFLSERPDAAQRTVVRVNPGDLLADDLAAVVPAGARTICLPKAEPGTLAACGDLLGGLEDGLGPAPGTVRVVPLVETAAGLLEAAELARHPRTRNLAIGEADLTADLGITPSAEAHELWPLRMQLVVASAAAGIDPPTGPVSTDYRDLDALAASSAALARAGFGARSAIHPAQLEVINAAFSPSEEAVAAARELVEGFDAAVARGEAVWVDATGRMVDEAVVRSARRVLERAATGRHRPLSP